MIGRSVYDMNAISRHTVSCTGNKSSLMTLPGEKDLHDCVVSRTVMENWTVSLMCYFSYRF